MTGNTGRSIDGRRGAKGERGVAPERHLPAEEPGGSLGSRTVVVTGAAGFIGRHAVTRLVGEGWRVRALDIHDPPVPRVGEPDAVGPEGVEWFRADVRDDEALRPILAGAEVVVHLASAHLQHRAPAGWYHSVNVDGARTLVRIAASLGVRRLIHTSSVGVYGHVSSPPADEESPKHPTNDYEHTKLLGEVASLEEAERTGLEVTILRPGWVYGPGCPRTARLLRTIRRGRFFFVGDGANLRHPIHVSDTVEAFCLAIDAPAETTGRPYLIVGPESVRVRELVEICARVQGVAIPRVRLPRSAVAVGLGGVELAFRALRREPPVSRRSLAFFEHDNAFSGRAAAEGLGFEAKVGLEEGIRSTLTASDPISGGVRA